MANTSNISKLTTNFNVSPWYDDYDASKGYYRNLFRPGFPVQGRELTQSQTMLQKQIDRLGKHIFKDGSIVLPGTFTLHCNNSIIGPARYVKVNDVDNSNNTVSIDQFLDQTITGATNGVTAEINFVLDGTEASGNTKTIYVDYTTASNSNSSIKTFQAGEVLTCNAGTLVVASANATGSAATFHISEGVLFAKEHFIYFPEQTIVIGRYDSSPSVKVGFTVTEEIVRYTDDASLLDPALEASNYSAPGADRLKLSAILTAIDIDTTDEPQDFVPLFVLRNGIIESQLDRSQYNILQDEMAKRTFDESGHYYVNGLNISLREHLNNFTNGGLVTSANGGNSQLLSVQVSPGTAYVQGYEIGKLVTSFLTTEKALSYSSVNSQITSATMGSYVVAKEFTGSWGMDQGTIVDLYDTAQQRLTTSKWSTGAQTGTKIGTAKIMSVAYESGTEGTPSATYHVFLSDISMLGSNNFTNVKSIFCDNASTADMGADIVLNSSNNAVLYESAHQPLLYYTGADYTKTIKPSGVSDTTFTYRSTTSVANVAAGTFNVSLPSGASQFPYGTATLTTAQKRDIIIALGGDANVSMSGTVANTGNTLVGSGTTFTNLNVGDKVAITGVSGVYYIQSIANATYLTLTTAVANTVSGSSFKKQYKTGDIIDLTVLGATGVTRAVSATASLLSFDLKETLSTTTPATISYPVSKTSASQINKTLRPDRFVKINCANNLAGTSGPFYLGIPDVYRIKEIRKDTSVFTSNTQGSNVTSSFVFSNGQKDQFYDHASVTPIGGIISSSDHLLVRLDYFEPDFTVGQGFFSIDSYPIDDANTSGTTINTSQIPIYKSPTSGDSYDLRNHLDFRPVKTKTSADATTVAAATTNPTSTAGFTFDVNGLRMPDPFSQVTFDYQYYLARKDVVTLNRYGDFTIVKGVPAAVPITPSVPDDVMSIGVLTIAPYPSLSLFYANIIGRKDLACYQKRTASIRFTMRDIGVLKDRIINLEQYAALSLLEKSALDLKIVDTLGNDRFKNGIFVDTFANHELGATYSSDYRIVVDPYEKSIRPLYNMDSVTYDYLSGSNIRQNGDIITLDYSEVLFITQPNVTTTRNTERTTYRFVGNLKLNPNDDIFVDTEWLPDQSVQFGPSNQKVAELQAGTGKLWNEWQTYITGYKVYRGGGVNQSQLVGTYTSAAEAQVSAQLQSQSGQSATIETLYSTSRSGVEKYITVDTETHSLGDKVVDVSLVHYIKPQTILVRADSLKPYSRYYVFFDQVKMTNYCTPLTETEYNSYVAISNSSFTVARTAQAEGSTLTADANGKLWMALRLPAGTDKRFYVGTKEIKVTDNPTNTDDATSFALGYFVAQGLVQTKQETILSTRQVINNQRALNEFGGNYSAIQVITPPPPPPVDDGNWNGTSVTNTGGDANCLAYAFKVKAPAGEEGAFITSIDVFVSDKHPTLGVWFEILEMDAGGGITKNRVPFSYVHKDNSDVTVSPDGVTNPLNVRFDAPVFLQNDKYYAFVMHPDAANANYYFWISRIGLPDVNTGNPVNSRSYTGTMYTTNNGVIWNIVEDTDLTCNIYRASFVTGVTGVALIGNKPREKLSVANLSSALTRYGEVFVAGDKLTLANISGGSIVATDLVIGANSNVNSAVVAVATTYNMANTGYRSGEAITVRYANGTSKGVTATISSIATTPKATLYKAVTTATENILHMSGSNGLFRANDRIFNFTTNDYATVSQIRNYRYSVVDLEPAYLNFNKTTIEFSMNTYSNTGTAGTFTPITPSENYYFDEEKAIYSRSNEVTSFGGARTNQVQTSMYSNSDYLSPVLDIGRTQTITVDNIINSNVVNENAASGGGELYNKYISKTITLEDGQDAEDMTLKVTGYRPPGTDIKVWIKVANAEDADTITNRGWIELEKKNNGDTVYSSLSNRSNFIEYKYGFETANLTGSLGQVQYINSANNTFTGYKYFSVKIGLLSDNSAIVPRAADLQAICTQI